MKVNLGVWESQNGWRFQEAEALDQAQLLIYFAAPEALSDHGNLDELRKICPAASLFGCSTGGEIFDGDVLDGTIVAAAIHFDQAQFKIVSTTIGECADSVDAGRRLGEGLPPDNLRLVFILSDGTLVNGSDLVVGLKQVLPEGTILTGGLAGDGRAFLSTKVGAEGPPAQGVIAALALYGDGLAVRHGSFSGWDSFGLERIVTRSERNILYELDGEPALDLYKRYLGDEARNLPGSALLFPLKILTLGDSRTDLVRTVVGIDEATKSMIFAGDIPTGASAQMMRGNFTHLINAAGEAARQAMGDGSGTLAILISCIGRKLLLGQRIADEVESVSDVLGSRHATIGFYSYGEISPHSFTNSCELHNQTMTITIIGES